MSELKVPIGINVLEASRARISNLFDAFDKVSVCFSGGKDSTVLMHLVAEVAAEKGRTFNVIFIDWEAQYKETIRHVACVLDEYKSLINPMWVALPLTTVNAVSNIEPEWQCWDPTKRDIWVRESPPNAITDERFFPFYKHGMTFEDFVEELTVWLGGVSLIGLRAGESLNRFRTLINTGKETWCGQMWTTKAAEGVYKAFPLYDWRTQDIWTYLGKYQKSYNRVYDRMHQAGLSLHQMRICEPYGDEQRKGLYLFHVLEPETWAKVSARVAGANSGALYAEETGNVLGNRVISLPRGHTWKSFAMFLLDTIPKATAEHYKNKIAVYLKWYSDHGEAELPDVQAGDTGSKDVGSWRRICKMLLKNDYWAKTLSFSPTKTNAYARYQDLMRRRRKDWGIFA